MVTRRKYLKYTATGIVAATLLPHMTVWASPSESGILPQNNRTENGKYRPRYRFGLGGAPIGGSSGLAVSDDMADKILENAWQSEVRLYDTSPWYGLGLSERRFGRLLHDKPRDSFILSSKIGRILTPAAKPPETAWADPDSFDFTYDYSADATRRSVEDSLQRLGVSSLDIVFIHDLTPENLGDEYETHIRAAIKGAMPELTKMRDEKMIKGWGMGVNSLPPILRANESADPDIHLAACQYTLMDHKESLEKLFPQCEKLGNSIMVGSPLNNGFLAGRDRYNYDGIIPDGFKEKRAKMQKIAKAHGIDLRTAALHFCNAPKHVSCVIPGAREAHQIVENVASIQSKVPADFWAELKAEKLIEEQAPTPA